jgi:hypothetical protein
MLHNTQLKAFRRLMLLFIIILFISGATAIPIDTELAFLLKIVPAEGILHTWLNKVLLAYTETKSNFPFLLYGYDWLAFAHFILAILFIGPYRDPVKNIWVIQFGLIACALVFPLAFIAGHSRDIPIGWQLIDCSFGLFAFILLWICYIKTKQLTAALAKGKLFPLSSPKSFQIK